MTRSVCGDAMRGSNAIIAGLDLNLSVKHDRRSGVLTIAGQKQRDQPVSSFQCQFVTSNDAEGKLDTTAFYGLSRHSAKPIKEDKTVAIQNTIRDILTSEQVLNQSRLASLVQVRIGTSEKKNREVIKMMAKAGQIVLTRGNTNNKALCSLPYVGAAIS